MRIAAAQTRPVLGDLAHNLAQHQTAIRQAAAAQASLVLFPELSLTGYAPSRAAALAMMPSDPRLDPLQRLSQQHRLVIAAGAPVPTPEGVQIGMLLFHPDGARQVYAKRRLHADEEPFFVPGRAPVALHLGGEVLVPAICYESLLPEISAEAAERLGATVLLASVAKPEAGIGRAWAHYEAVARQYGVAVVLSSSEGAAEGLVGAGYSAAWRAGGARAGSLGGEGEGLLVYDTETGMAVSS